MKRRKGRPGRSTSGANLVVPDNELPALLFHRRQLSKISTVLLRQSVVFTISASVTPWGLFNRAITSAFLLLRASPARLPAMARSLALVGVSSASPRRAQHSACGSWYSRNGPPTAYRLAFHLGSHSKARGGERSSWSLSLPFKTRPVNLRRPSGGRRFSFETQEPMRSESSRSPERRPPTISRGSPRR